MEWAYIICGCLSIVSVYLIIILSPLIIEPTEGYNYLFIFWYALISLLYFITAFLAFVDYEHITKFAVSAEEGQLINPAIISAMPLTFSICFSLFSLLGGIWGFICYIPTLISIIYIFPLNKSYSEDLFLLKIKELNFFIKEEKYDKAFQLGSLLDGSFDLEDRCLRGISDISIDILIKFMKNKNQQDLAIKLCNLLLNDIYQNKSFMDISKLRDVRKKKNMIWH